MKRWFASALIVLVGVMALGLSACAGDDIPSTQTITVSSTTTGTVAKIFSSSQYKYADKQDELAKQLTDFVNSGTWNIIEVHTYHTNGFLTGAEVTYDPTTSWGKGNSLRLQLIYDSTTTDFLDDMGTKVTKAYNAFLSGQQDPTRSVFQTIPVYDQGYLVMVEIWSFEK